MNNNSKFQLALRSSVTQSFILLLLTKLRVLQQQCTIQMSSFELVNHQLKHLFGGIEAEKNPSLEQLEASQKKIAKAMERAQASHMKIYQAVATIKTSLNELNENYLALAKEKGGGLLGRLSQEMSGLLQDVGEESLSLAKKMESKAETYIPNLKRIKEKYTQCAETLEHYRRKLSLLQKNVDRQSLANIKQDQHERYERNKEKLRNAEKEHDQLLIKTTKRFVEFNSEGLRDVYNDLVSLLANITGNLMKVSSSITNYLINTVSHDRQVRQRKQSKSGSTGEWLKGQTIDGRRAFLDQLVQESQIASYLKKLVDQELVRSDPPKIQEAFKAKNIKTEAKEVKETSAFTHFQNQFVSHQIKHKQHHILDKVREEDPMEACEDLLEIEQPTEISRAISNEEISKYDLDGSPQSPKIDEERRKANLERFNKICEANLLDRQRSPTAHIKPLDKAISPNLKAIQIYKLQNSNYVTAKTVLKSPDQFFNLANFEGMQQKSKSRQEQLLKLHQHAFDFNIPINSLTPTKPNAGNRNQPATNPKQNEPLLRFDNFDLLLQNPKQSLKPANGNSINLLNL